MSAALVASATARLVTFQVLTDVTEWFMVVGMTKTQQTYLLVMTSRPERGSGVTKRHIARAAADLTGVPVSDIDVEYEAEYLHDNEARRRNLRLWEAGATGRCYIGGQAYASEMSEALYG